MAVIDQVIDAVSMALQINPQHMRTHTRCREVVKGKRLVSYFMADHLGWSQRAIAANLGCMTHQRARQLVGEARVQVPLYPDLLAPYIRACRVLRIHAKHR